MRLLFIVMISVIAFIPYNRVLGEESVNLKDVQGINNDNSSNINTGIVEKGYSGQRNPRVRKCLNL